MSRSCLLCRKSEYVAVAVAAGEWEQIVGVVVVAGRRGHADQTFSRVAVEERN